MVKEIAVENNWIFKSEGLVTLTLALDPGILHTVVHHLSTSTYTPNTPNFTEMEETFLRTDEPYTRMDEPFKVT